MLALLERGRAQVSVHFDEIIQLVADDSVMGPLLVRDLGFDPPQPPAGLLLDLPGQCLLRRLSWLDVAARHIPGAGKPGIRPAGCPQPGVLHRRDFVHRSGVSIRNCLRP